MTSVAIRSDDSIDSLVQRPAFTVFQPATQDVIHPDSWDAVFELREDKFIAKRFMDKLEAYHPPTAYHSMDVCYHADVLAQQLGVPATDREDLRIAALLHDYGKIHVPLSILNSPTALTQEQKEVMARHVRWGFRPIKKGFGVRVAAIQAPHHEYQDDPNAEESGTVRIVGTYPRRSGESYIGVERRTRDEGVERCAEILAATDQVVSLLADRTYKSSMNPFTARQLLRKQFTGNQDYIDMLLPTELTENPQLKQYLFPRFDRKYVTSA